MTVGSDRRLSVKVPGFCDAEKRVVTCSCSTHFDERNVVSSLSYISGVLGVLILKRSFVKVLFGSEKTLPWRLMLKAGYF
jgi:hypothetical protein